MDVETSERAAVSERSPEIFESKKTINSILNVQSRKTTVSKSDVSKLYYKEKTQKPCIHRARSLSKSSLPSLLPLPHNLPNPFHHPHHNGCRRHPGPNPAHTRRLSQQIPTPRNNHTPCRHFRSLCTDFNSGLPGSVPPFPTEPGSGARRTGPFPRR